MVTRIPALTIDEPQLKIFRRHEPTSVQISIQIAEKGSAFRGRNVRGGLLDEHEQRGAIAANGKGRHASF